MTPKKELKEQKIKKQTTKENKMKEIDTLYTNPHTILQIARRKVHTTETDVPTIETEVREELERRAIDREMFELIQRVKELEDFQDNILKLHAKGFRLGAIYPTFETDVDKETGEIFFRCSCEEGFEKSTGKKSQKPCKSPGKHPIGLWHPAGVWNFSRNLKSIAKYWKEPKAQNKTDQKKILPNVAIATGINFFVIDIDKKNGKNGYSNIHIVKQIIKHFPIIGKVKTPSGGEHIYCQAEGFLVKSTNLCDGIEIKGYGTYVLAPPSQVNGIPYIETQTIQPVKPESELRPTKVLEFAINKRGLDIKERNENPDISFREFETLRNKKIREFEELAQNPGKVKEEYESANGFDIAIILSLKRRGYSDSEILAYYKRFLIGKSYHMALLRRFNFDYKKIYRYILKTAIPLANKALKESNRRLDQLLRDYYELLQNKHLFRKKEGLSQTDREVLTFLLTKALIDLKRDTIRISLSKINENLPSLSSSAAVSDSIYRLVRKGFITILEKGKGGEKDTNRRGTVYKINPVPKEIKEKYIFFEEVIKTIRYHDRQKMVLWYRTELNNLFQEDALTGQSGRLERAFFNVFARNSGKRMLSAKEVSEKLGCSRSSALRLLKRLAKKGYGKIAKHKCKFLFKLFSTSRDYLKKKFHEVAEKIGRVGFLKERIEKIRLRRFESYERLRNRSSGAFEIVKVG